MPAAVRYDSQSSSDDTPAFPLASRWRVLGRDVVDGDNA
jgi:hypothetical protein